MDVRSGTLPLWVLVCGHVATETGNTVNRQSRKDCLQANMLKKAANAAGVIELLDQGFMTGGTPYIITRPFVTLLDDSAELIVSVVQQAARTIDSLPTLDSPVLHRDISIGNIVYHRSPGSACLINYGSAVSAPTESFKTMTPNSITGTTTFMARRVLEGRGYSLSSELQSLMYVTIYLAVEGLAHWANKPVGSMALAFKVQTFADKEGDKFVMRCCHPDLMGAVLRLWQLFWHPCYQRTVTAICNFKRHCKYCNAPCHDVKYL